MMSSFGNVMPNGPDVTEIMRGVEPTQDYSWVGEDASMWRSVARANVVPRPAKPARQSEYARRVA